MTAVSQSVDLDRRGRVAVLTVDNPPVNALSQHVRQGLHDGIKQAQADGAVQASDGLELDESLLAACYESDQVTGKLYENFVAMEIARLLDWAETSATQYHYRDRSSGDEIDIVLPEVTARVAALEHLLIEKRLCTRVDLIDARAFVRVQEA